ncbi:hypothetical protein BaRGS_00028437 [Batillaria attramentaria]|uniref:Uncharacterized protein n=1 Tax=Batillaria attramentaria TaxID=370345 RepID=A0ABD0JZV8_9CAEN
MPLDIEEFLSKTQVLPLGARNRGCPLVLLHLTTCCSTGEQAVATLLSDLLGAVMPRLKRGLLVFRDLALCVGLPRYTVQIQRSRQTQVKPLKLVHTGA